MLLLQLGDGLDDTVTCAAIAHRDIRKVYALRRVRTSWHSTRSERSDADWVYPTITQAKNAAELMRMQGTAFYIDELPAACFEADGDCLVATQLCTPDVLGGYSHRSRFSTSSPPNCPNPSTPDPFRLGTPLRTAVKALRPKSGHWYNSQRAPVVLYRWLGALSDLPPFTGGGLKGFWSQSFGPRYLLWWGEYESRVSAEHAARMVGTYAEN